jgi:hypothetical protein
MIFFEWLEASRLSEWAQVSLIGYPLIITAHSIGLAIMVGIVFMLDLRLIGFFKGISYSSLSRILSVAWIGFVVNFISGLVLFTMEATRYVAFLPFLIKISCVLLGGLLAAYQHRVITRDAASWNTNGVPVSVTAVAILSLIFWAGAIVAGRLIAYL